MPLNSGTMKDENGIFEEGGYARKVANLNRVRKEQPD
ncbi:MAG: hypothetical protein PWQ41_516 [Bacillota bacterium]|nr:hypothetical protein [Bacillota bacterium]MDK2856414.1 hypothetical protein [Bacillota bacterium]MDK2924742.1 hypothetical protein [Bacillota bacterium]